jgi:hypothetical protein
VRRKLIITYSLGEFLYDMPNQLLGHSLAPGFAGAAHLSEELSSFNGRRLHPVVRCAINPVRQEDALGPGTIAHADNLAHSHFFRLKLEETTSDEEVSISPRFFVPNPMQHHGVLDWHNVPQEFYYYASTFHVAAKKLAEAMEMELDSGPFTKFSACPVVFMYRHAIELHLMTFVLGEGGNFLATKPDWSRSTRPIRCRG